MMKKIVALATAATIAAGIAVASTGEAAAHPGPGPNLSFGFSFGGPGYYPGPYQYPHMYRPYMQPRPMHRSNFRWSKHVQWCSWRYKTYNPASNTFFIRKGVRAVCVSPYSY